MKEYFDHLKNGYSVVLVNFRISYDLIFYVKKCRPTIQSQKTFREIYPGFINN